MNSQRVGHDWAAKQQQHNEFHSISANAECNLIFKLENVKVGGLVLIFFQVVELSSSDPAPYSLTRPQVSWWVEAQGCGLCVWVAVWRDGVSLHKWAEQR